MRLVSPGEGSWKADARNEVRVDCCVLTVPAYNPSTSRVSFFFFFYFPVNGELLLRWGRNTPNELLAHGKRVDSPCQSHRCPSRCSTPFSFSVACCSLWQAGGGAVLPLGGSQLTLFIISALSGNGFHL